jgi:gamma-glutamyl-gamma-aminobutyrate hydrolase PuuD
VVSHHHQGIAELARGFEPWATAPDGLVEGIRWADTASVSYLVGVQYHPERSRKGHLLTDGLGAGLLQAAGIGE